MHTIVDSDKSFYEVSVDLEEAALRLGFVILKRLDVGELLAAHGGTQFDEACLVFEVGHYRLMEELLAIDPVLGLGLPWRIALFTENGATRISLLRPTVVLHVLSSRDGVAALAAGLEERLRLLVNEAR